MNPARPLFTAAGVLFLVFLGTFVTGSLIDPEDIGGRLLLYGLGILSFLAGLVVLIVALVRRARARS